MFKKQSQKHWQLMIFRGCGCFFKFPWKCVRPPLESVSLTFFLFLDAAPGGDKPGHPGDVAVYGVRVWGVQQRARRPASHLQTGKGVRSPAPLPYPSPPSVGPSFHRLTDLRDKWQCLYLTVTPALFFVLFWKSVRTNLFQCHVFVQSTAAVICGTVVFCINMGTLVDMLSCCPLRRLCGRSPSVCSLNGNVRVCLFLLCSVH